MANYDGRCVVCDERIEADYDMVVFDENEGGWVHEDCSDTEFDDE